MKERDAGGGEGFDDGGAGEQRGKGGIIFEQRSGDTWQWSFLVRRDIDALRRTSRREREREDEN